MLSWQLEITITACLSCCFFFFAFVVPSQILVYRSQNIKRGKFKTSLRIQSNQRTMTRIVCSVWQRIKIQVVQLCATEDLSSAGRAQIVGTIKKKKKKGCRSSKWGACLKQTASSLRCQTHWVGCPNSCALNLGNEHTNTHTILSHHVKGGSSPTQNPTVLSPSSMLFKL